MIFPAVIMGVRGGGGGKLALRTFIRQRINDKEGTSFANQRHKQQLRKGNRGDIFTKLEGQGMWGEGLKAGREEKGNEREPAGKKTSSLGEAVSPIDRTGHTKLWTENSIALSFGIDRREWEKSGRKPSGAWRLVEPEGGISF